MSARKQRLSASECVEAYLRARFEKNVERLIDARENVVIQRLLKRSVEMRPVYAELSRKLPLGPVVAGPPAEAVMDAVVTVAAQWNPARMSAARKAASRLSKLTRHIGDGAAKLAELMKKRSDLALQHGLYVDELDAIDLVEFGAAFGDARRGALFDGEIKPKLYALRSQFDYKYWPTAEEIIRGISRVAAGSTVVASDHITAAALAPREHSTADFFRALFQYLENVAHSPLLPRQFHLTDSALATIGTCALGLDAGTIPDEYVKSLRQKLRSRQKGTYWCGKKCSE